MAFISLIGPNAIGKTTALQRWSKRYGSMLTAIFCDNNLVIRRGVEERIRGKTAWKGSVDEKRVLVQYYCDQQQEVVVAESARTSNLHYIRPGAPVILVTCTPEVHEANMRRRCELKGKKFRDDYWDRTKLIYESAGRYMNFPLPNNPVQHFRLLSMGDWDKVDEAFYALFRKCYNQLQRRPP